jgi:hypothetical protein
MGTGGCRRAEELEADVLSGRPAERCRVRSAKHVVGFSHAEKSSLSMYAPDGVVPPGEGRGR